MCILFYDCDLQVSPLVEGEQPQITATTEVKVAAKRILIKTADIGNPCRPEELCVKWAKRIAEEYFKQVQCIDIYGTALSRVLVD